MSPKHYNKRYKQQQKKQVFKTTIAFRFQSSSRSSFLLSYVYTFFSCFEQLFFRFTQISPFNNITTNLNNKSKICMVLT